MEHEVRPPLAALPRRTLAAVLTGLLVIALAVVMVRPASAPAHSGSPAPQKRNSDQAAVGPPAAPLAVAPVHSAKSPSTFGEAVAAAPTPDGKGFWIAWADGAVTTVGDAHLYGSLSNVHLSKPVVGIAATPNGEGYWLLGADGGVFSFGDARFYGSTGGSHLNAPALQMVSTADGRGYDFVAGDGGIFSFGDARFYGSTGNMHLAKPVVGMATTPAGDGYWLVAADGGIFSFGDAPFYGSTGAIHLAQPVVGMASTADGKGYWLVAADGGIFAFGDARFYGSGSGRTGGARAVGVVAANGGRGYWIVLSDGVVLAEGDASPVSGSASPEATAPPTDTQYHFEVTNAAGQPMRWNPCLPVDYAVVPSGAPAGWQGDVRNAIAQVASATHLDLVSLGTFGSSASVPASADLIISWTRSLSGGDYVGLATYWYYDLPHYSPQVVKATVQILSSLHVGDGLGGELPVLLHELGHAMGLAHTPNEPEVMNPYDIGLPNYQLGDLNGLWRVGAAAGCSDFYKS